MYMSETRHEDDLVSRLPVWNCLDCPDRSRVESVETCRLAEKGGTWRRKAPEEDAGAVVGA